MRDEDCRSLAQELKELTERLKDMMSQLMEATSDLRSILAAERELLSCLRLHSPDYFSQLSLPEYAEVEDLSNESLEHIESDNINEMDCDIIKRRLLAVRSREASLAFRLTEVSLSLRTEAIRLSGLIALCRHFEPELSEDVYKKIGELVIDKYVLT